MQNEDLVPAEDEDNYSLNKLKFFKTNFLLTQKEGTRIKLKKPIETFRPNSKNQVKL